MTGRDAARDELARRNLLMILGMHMSERAAENVADDLLSMGYRRSVTPGQIAAAEAVFGTEYHNLIVGVAHQFWLEVTE